MLHEQIRKARLAAGLTHSDVARIAGVQRRDIRKLEQGENVTLSTVRKVMAAIPELNRRKLGVLEPHQEVDLEALRTTAEEMMALGRSILAVIGGSPEARPAPQIPPDDYAARYISPELWEQMTQVRRYIDRVDTRKKDAGALRDAHVNVPRR